MEIKEVYTIYELADLFQVSYTNLWTKVRSGKIPAFKVGNQWRITRETVNKIKSGKLQI